MKPILGHICVQKYLPLANLGEENRGRAARD